MHAMNQTDKLYYLIRSLTPSEKRYFTVFSKRHKLGGDANKYSLLFAVINDLDGYDEAEVRRRLARHNVHSDLPSLKVDLYRLILKAMREFRSEKNIGIQLRELLDDAYFLREKGLYEQCSELLARARDIAALYEEHWSLARIADLERTLAYDTTDKHLVQRITAINARKTALFATMENLHRMQCLYDRVFTQVRINPNGVDATVRSRLEATMSDQLLRSVKNAPSFDARCYFYNTHAHYTELTGRPARSFAYQKKLLAHWERHPERIHREPHRYIKALSNYAGLCMTMKRFSEVEHVIDKLEGISLRTFDEEAERFQNLWHLRIFYLINTAQFESVVDLLPVLHESMDTYAPKINPARRLTLYYNIAVLCFCIGRYQESLEWLNRIIDDRRAEVRRDILVCAHLLCPVAHFELGNHGFIDSLIRRMQRYLQSVGPRDLQQFERDLLKFLRRLSTPSARTRKRHTLYRAMQQKIEDMLRSGTPRLGLHELSCWLESKITRRRIADVCRERMKQR